MARLPYLDASDLREEDRDQLARPINLNRQLVHSIPTSRHFWDLANWIRFDATVDLVDGVPTLVRFVAEAAGGLDLVRLQREFRWATPIDVVTRLVPEIVAGGGDPFDHEYPVDGFPEVIDAIRTPVNRALDDAFLEGIAREYLTRGRGYAQQIATARGVSRRTVVSWVEKARRRGILTSPGPGIHGGEIIPPGRRAPTRAPTPGSPGR